jgi:RNA polymerase sigma-70 factor, ECF subfamily
MAAFRFISALEAAGATLTMSEPLTESRTAEQKIEAAVREHAQLVFKICYAVVRNHHDAEDATQDVFLRVWRNASRLNEIEDLRSWIARIAWNVAIDRKRKPVEQQIDEHFEVSQGARAEQDVISGQMLVLLERAIARLPRKEREALILASTEEMSMAEIGKVLGASEATVRGRVFRARQQLRERMKKFTGIGR